MVLRTDGVLARNVVNYLLYLDLIKTLADWKVVVVRI